MAYNNYAPFWDFVRGFEREGAGVDHNPNPRFPGPPPPPPPPHAYGGFPFAPFGGPPMFGGFPHPHHAPVPAGDHQRNGCGPGGCQHGPADTNQPDDAQPDGERRSHRGPRGPHGRGRHHGPGGAHPPPPFGHFGQLGGFDMNNFMGSLSAHPLAQAFRTWAEQAATGPRDNPDDEDPDSENTFTPPVDIFSTETQYVLQ
jgi:HSP20 family protein